MSSTSPRTHAMPRVLLTTYIPPSRQPEIPLRRYELWHQLAGCAQPLSPCLELSPSTSVSPLLIVSTHTVRQLIRLARLRSGRNEPEFVPLCVSPSPPRPQALRVLRSHAFPTPTRYIQQTRTKTARTTTRTRTDRPVRYDPFRVRPLWHPPLEPALFESSRDRNRDVENRRTDFERTDERRAMRRLQQRRRPCFVPIC
jgi:hypothetical protein